MTMIVTEVTKTEDTTKTPSGSMARKISSLSYKLVFLAAWKYIWTSY
jgi:hypothetical protein